MEAAGGSGMTDSDLRDIATAHGLTLYRRTNGERAWHDMREGALLAFARAVERRALERAESGFASLLPWTYYMDPPDGGDVSVLEQVRRMTEDAARYRLLRQKICIVGNAFHIINVSPTYVAPDAAIELDAVLDSAMQSKAAGSNHG